MLKIAESKPCGKKLKGKEAIVTGGASGIGEATVHHFINQCARAVVIADVQDEKGEKLAASIGDNRCTFIHCDLTKEQDVESLVQSTVRLYGCLDIMFSNAGTISKSVQTIIDFDLSSCERVFPVNVLGVAASVKHAAHAMIEGKVRGSIACTVSIAASQGGDIHTDYGMSKHAVLGLVRSTSLQLGKYGIKVNCVSPGPVATPLLEETFGKGRKEIEGQFERFFSLKNTGALKVNRVADAVWFSWPARRLNLSPDIIWSWMVDSDRRRLTNEK